MLPLDGPSRFGSMTVVRSFPDEMSTSRMPRPKRWEWLIGVLQRSNLTSSDSEPLAALACAVADWKERSVAIARSEATKQSTLVLRFMDCFAEPVIGRAFARPVGSQWRWGKYLPQKLMPEVMGSGVGRDDRVVTPAARWSISPGLMQNSIRSRRCRRG